MSKIKDGYILGDTEYIPALKVSYVSYESKLTILRHDNLDIATFTYRFNKDPFISRMCTNCNLDRYYENRCSPYLSEEDRFGRRRRIRACEVFDLVDGNDRYEWNFILIDNNFSLFISSILKIWKRDIIL